MFFENKSDLIKYIKNHFYRKQNLKISDKREVVRGTWFENNVELNVVIKTVEKMNIQKSFSSSTKKQMQQANEEFFFLKRISKLHISPKPLFCLETPSTSSTVMEAFSEEWIDLSDYFSLTFDVKTIPQILKNVIKILLLLNKHNVYYTDTKAENIMINQRTLEIKFIDFEDAILHKKFLSKCISNKQYGTVGYCAPEIYDEDFYDVEKSQVFNFGTFMFSLYEIRIPFDDEEDTRRMNYSMSGKTPKEMREIIECCLKLNPEERPSLKTIANALKNINNSSCINKES